LEVAQVKQPQNKESKAMLGEIFSDEIVVLQEEIRIKEAQVSMRWLH
jgi:hypothetical protein